MTHLEKIEKAKARLMLEHPYFGTVVAALKLPLLTVAGEEEIICGSKA